MKGNGLFFFFFSRIESHKNLVIAYRFFRITCSSGRCANLIADDAEFSGGTYKLNFLVKDYYDSVNVKSMYPLIDVIFDIDKSEHYHIPLLLNAFGFTTYRGT